MSRGIRLAVLAAALLSSIGAMSSTAGAVTWHNTGDTAFTATGGAGTLSSTNVALNCTGSSVTGSVPATTVGTTLAISGTKSFSGCLLSGQSVGFHCGFSITLSSQSGAVSSGALDWTCRVYLATIPICHFFGTIGVSFTNPFSPSTFAKFSTTTGGSVRVTNGSSNCPMGNGDLVHVSPMTFTVSTATGGPTPHLGPSITRTA